MTRHASPAVDALLREARKVLETFLVEPSEETSFPRGWIEDFNGGVEKSASSGGEIYRVAVGYDGETTFSEDEISGGGAYFSLSISRPGREDCDEGLTIEIDDFGRVCRVIDWFSEGSDDCVDLLARSQLSPLLTEGNRLLPFRL